MNIYQLLQEATRSQLIDKSKKADKTKSYGTTRYDRRTKSKMSTNVAQYNKIDMDALFKRDILTVGIDVQGETNKYVVTVRFSGVLEEIRKAVKQNNGKLEYKAIAQAMSRVFNSGDVSLNCTCLHPSTKIKLLDGTNPTVEEMCKRFENGEKLWVFSTDENGDFKPGEVEKVWQTKTTQEFIKVTLDNGEEILTTPEHPYMLRDGSYSFAMDLQEGQSLMPLYFNQSNGYLTVKLNTEARGWRAVYKLVAEELKKTEILEKEKQAETDSTDMTYKVAIHHKDFNKNNNTPDNLQVMTSKEHWNYHASLCGENRPITEKMREVSRENAYKRNANPTEKMIEQRKRFIQAGAKMNYDENRKLQQSEIMRKVSRDFWDNPENEEKRKKVIEASHTEEVRKKTSESHKKLWQNMSEEEYQKRCQQNKESNAKCKQKISEGVKRARQNKTEEELKLWYQHISESQKGKKIEPFTEEHKQKISQAHLNRTQEQKREHSNKILLTNCKKVIQKIINANNCLSEENYKKYRCASNEPFIETVYNKLECTTFEQVLDLCGFKDTYNHKIIKIEKIILEDTPVYDIKVKTWENFLVDAGVVLHNCPDQQYRMRYWAGKNGYGTQYEPRPSDITNPNDTKGAGCKHTMLVISRLDWMMKVGSVINNYIKYCQEHLQKSYADYIFPKIYGMKYDKAIQMGLFDTGLLPSDQQTLSDITAQQQKQRDEKGRFVAGNEYRFTKENPEDKGIVPDDKQQQFQMNATETEFEKPGSVKQLTIDDYDNEGKKIVGNGEEVKDKRKYTRKNPLVGKKIVPVSKDQISMFDDEEDEDKEI